MATLIFWPIRLAPVVYYPIDTYLEGKPQGNHQFLTLNKYLLCYAILLMLLKITFLSY
jgi:hypothetical protein